MQGSTSSTLLKVQGSVENFLTFRGPWIKKGEESLPYALLTYPIEVHRTLDIKIIDLGQNPNSPVVSNCELERKKQLYFTFLSTVPLLGCFCTMTNFRIGGLTGTFSTPSQIFPLLSEFVLSMKISLTEKSNLSLKNPSNFLFLQKSHLQTNSERIKSAWLSTN